MTPDIAAAADRLARDATALASLARSADEARSIAATWPDQVSDSWTLVERVAAIGMRRKLEDVASSARMLIAASKETGG